MRKIYILLLFVLISILPIISSYVIDRGADWDLEKVNNKFKKTYYSGIINYQINNSYEPINTTVVNLNVSFGTNDYIYGVDRGLYQAYFKESSTLLTPGAKPVAMVKDDYIFMFTPAVSTDRYINFNKDCNGSNFGKRIAAKQASNAIINGDIVTYPNQYKNYQQVVSFGNLTYKYLKDRLKEELVIGTRDFIQSRYDNCYDDFDTEILMEFTMDIQAFYQEDISSNSMGINIGKLLKTPFKSFGLFSDNEITTSDEVHFTDSSNTTIFYIPELYAYDNNGSEILLNKTLSMVAGGALRIITLTPFWWLNSSDRVYPIMIDPTVTYNQSDTTNYRCQEVLTNVESCPIVFPDNLFDPVGCTLANCNGAATALLNDDDVNETSGIERDDKGSLIISINLSDLNTDDITNLEWTFGGSVLISGGLPPNESGWVYMWNHTNDSRYECSTINRTDITHTLCNTTGLNVDDFINSSGYTHLKTWGNASPGGALYHDIIRLEVTYDAPGNAPILNTSNNTNFSTSTPNLKWNNATDTGNSASALTYHLQIDNDSAFSSVTYQNNTIPENVTPTNHTIATALSDSFYYWRVRSNTSQGLNSSWSNVSVFRVDTTGPTITITDPGDTEELISNVSINLNFTVSDALLTVDTCWFNLWNSTDYEIGNTTITSCGNTTFNTSNSGTFNVTLYANDTLNNINLETNEFTITLSAPAITLSNPTDTEFLNSGTDVLFNFTASDSNGLGNCALYHNSTATFALNLSNSTSVVSGTPYNFTQNFTDSDYLWNIFCNDTLGNGRFSANNRTFTVDSTDPNITNVSITTTQGSQTISFDVNVSDVNLDSCIYSIFNSSDAIDGLNDGVSVGCNSAGNAATVASFGTYNLQISASDLASNTNSTNTSFTTEDTSAPPAEGGGVTPPSVTQRIRLPSTNFSIVTTNFGDKMDFVLAKGSLRPREKDFILVNQDIEPIIIDLVCDTESLLANETTEEGSEINICDFVQFENETLSLTPNEIENTIGRVRITTPTDAKFGDQYNFNILALSNVSETEILFAKLSVTSRVPLWGKIFSWKKIPLSSQTAVSEVTGEEVPTRVFPLIFLALFVSFSLFVTVLVLTRKAFPLAGFALSVIFFVGSFTGIIIFL